MNKTITCISCPIGCRLDVSAEDGKVTSVKGNKCKRGIVYAESEIISPVRTLTTSVYIKSKELMLPVRSDKPIPKGEVFNCVGKIKRLSVELPVKTGDILLHDIVDGVNIISSDDMEE
mgnify:CR=1 FL=1